jgi:hypothetical protein
MLSTQITNGISIEYSDELKNNFDFENTYYVLKFKKEVFKSGNVRIKGIFRKCEERLF